LSSNRYPIHLCLVSSQPIPNLVPSLDPDLRPQRVVLVASKKMLTPAFHLETVFQERGIPCERLEISDAYDAKQTTAVIEAFLNNCECSQVALNVTGGTKIMALAAHAVFLRRKLPVFFVHPEKDEMIWLHPQQPSVEIRDFLTLEDFLRAHGFYVKDLQREAMSQELFTLTKEMVADIDHYAKPLSLLNFLAASAENNPHLQSQPVRPHDRKKREFQKFLELFKKNHLLRMAGNRLEFPNEKTRFFVNGGWFEQHIFQTILKLKDRLKIRDCASSVVIHSESGTPNEVDVAFLWNNRLHLIECKARRFADQRSNSGAETLYKMDTLRDLGGPLTRCLLASYQELPTWDQQRARDLNIKTLVGSELMNLEYELLQWITR
jgi:Card1-like, endonuclease domain